MDKANKRRCPYAKKAAALGADRLRVHRRGRYAAAFRVRVTGGNPLIAAFCAVNESTWEHMKLLFVPFFLFTMVQFIVFAEPLRSFFAAKAASILLGLLAIPVLFYSLGGMFGKTPDWVNIAIFFLADALLYLMSFRLLTRGALRGGAWQLAGFLLLWALAFAFVFFTYRPIHLPLWQDPTNGLYGLAAARAAG